MGSLYQDVDQHQGLRINSGLLEHLQGLDVRLKREKDLLGFHHLCVEGGGRVNQHVLQHVVSLGPDPGEEPIDGLV